MKTAMLFILPGMENISKCWNAQNIDQHSTALYAAPFMPGKIVSQLSHEPALRYFKECGLMLLSRKLREKIVFVGLDHVAAGNLFSYECQFSLDLSSLWRPLKLKTMDSRRSEQDSGGFILPTGLLSPSPSAVSSTAGILPQPRATALKSGGVKETALVNIVEGKLRDISARFERRFEGAHVTSQPVNDATSAYRNALAPVKDLNQIFDIIWVSGTRKIFWYIRDILTTKAAIQIPFLINIASALIEYIDPFPFVPEPTLLLLSKLDLAFSSLIHGEDMQTGERLPGFETGWKVNMTVKIRLRGLVERSRMKVIKLASRHQEMENSEAEFTDITDTDQTDDENMDIDTPDGLGNHAVGLDVARVYQRTLADLSDTLIDAYNTSEE